MRTATPVRIPSAPPSFPGTKITALLSTIGRIPRTREDDQPEEGASNRSTIHVSRTPPKYPRRQSAAAPRNRRRFTVWKRTIFASTPSAARWNRCRRGARNFQPARRRRIGEKAPRPSAQVNSRTRIRSRRMPNRAAATTAPGRSNQSSAAPTPTIENTLWAMRSACLWRVTAASAASPPARSRRRRTLAASPTPGTT